MRKAYNTVQKKYLYEILKKHKDRHLSAEEIYSLIPDKKLGKSTVYRLLSNLVGSGVLRRYTEEGSRQFLYQLVGGRKCDSHFHLKCLDCGRVIHLRENLSDTVASEIFSQYNFKIDEKKTVFLGQCDDCASLEIGCDIK